MREIAAAIAAEVSTDPAGDVEGANTRVRTGRERRSADEIAGIRLRTQRDGTALTIGDVARIRVAGAARDTAYFVGDSPAITVRVDRSSQGDALEIEAQVREVARNLERTVPEGVTLDLIRTRSEAISGRISMLLGNAATGLALVVGLLVPVSQRAHGVLGGGGHSGGDAGGHCVMYAAGLTLNMISLFAIIITLGIVVDDAIVVGEHADARHRRYGEPPPVAAERAATRMALPVFSATLTTLIAFFGLAFIGGRFGDLIYDIPFTVIAVLAASLVECFLILPHHMNHALAHSGRDHWYDLPSRVVNRASPRSASGCFAPCWACSSARDMSCWR